MFQKFSAEKFFIFNNTHLLSLLLNLIIFFLQNREKISKHLLRALKLISVLMIN